MKSRIQRAVLVLILSIASSCAIQLAGSLCVASMTPMDEEGRAFFQGKDIFDDGFYPEAAVQFKTILQKYPDSRFKMEIFFLLGQCAFQGGDLERARVHFHRVLKAKENPFQERALYHLGLVEYGLRNDAQVLKRMQEVLDKYPLGGYGGMARLYRGKSMLRMGRGTQARDVFEKLIQERPDKQSAGWAAVELAKTAQAHGRMDQTAKILKGLTASGNNPLGAGQLELWMATVLAAINQYKEAIPWYDSALTAGGAKESLRERALLGRAKMLFLTGDAGASATAYEDFLKQYPASRRRGWAQMGLALLRLESGDTQGARKSMEGVFRSGDSLRIEESLAFLGCRLTLKEKDFARAVELCRQFLVKYPKSAHRYAARYDAAFALFSLKKYPETLAALDQLLSAGSPAGLRREVFLLKGDAQRLGGNKEGAVGTYRQMAKEFPGDPRGDEVLHRLMFMFYQGRQWQEAADAAEEILRMYPASAWGEESLYRAGMSRFHRAEYGAAAVKFRQAVEKYPKGPYAQQAMYQEAVCWYQLGRFDEALGAYRLCRENIPGGPLKEMATVEMGWTYTAARRSEEAAAVFDEFLRKHPASAHVPAVLFWMGQNTLAQGKFAQSLLYFDKLVTDHPKHDLSDDAMLCGAIAMARGGSHEESNRRLQKLLSDHPATDLRLDVLMVQADNEASRKKYRRAVLLFAQILQQYPSDIRAPLVQLRMADCYAAWGEYRAAMVLYEKLAESLDGNLRAHASFKKALCLESLGDLEGAKSELMRLLYSSEAPRTWMGKAALMLGGIFEREDRYVDAMALYQKLSRQQSEEGAIARQHMERIKKFQADEEIRRVEAGGV